MAIRGLRSAIAFSMSTSGYPTSSRSRARRWLDTDLLRRDQIWFVEKDDHQASRLYPLSDFKPRKNEALEWGYLKGRYGGVPLVSEPRLDGSR